MCGVVPSEFVGFRRKVSVCRALEGLYEILVVYTGLWAFGSTTLHSYFRLRVGVWCSGVPGCGLKIQWFGAGIEAFLCFGLGCGAWRVCSRFRAVWSERSKQERMSCVVGDACESELRTALSPKALNQPKQICACRDTLKQP